MIIVFNSLRTGEANFSFYFSVSFSLILFFLFLLDFDIAWLIKDQDYAPVGINKLLCSWKKTFVYSQDSSSLHQEVIEMFDFNRLHFLSSVFHYHLDRMFGSRAFSSAPGGHRCTSSAKFTSTRQIENDIVGKFFFPIFCFSIELISLELILFRSLSNCWSRRWNSSKTKFSLCARLVFMLSLSR